MTHRIASNGVCQACGAHEPAHIAAPCAPRVVYVASRNSIIDYINPAGITFYGRKTLADCVAEDSDAVIMDADAAYELYQSKFKSPVSETTEERFDYALNVLPPGRWTGPASRQSFYVTERIAGNIVSWYAQCDGKFYTFNDVATLDHAAVMARVAVYIAGRVDPVVSNVTH